MLGIVATGLKDFIEINHSIAEWNKLLELSGMPDMQVLVAEHYNDEDIMHLVSTASKYFNVPMTDLVETFGHHLFGILRNYYPFIIQDFTSFAQLIHSLDDVIHPQVKKLHPNSIVPIFDVIDSENGWQVTYQSKRKLCLLALGLLHGAAEYYGVTIKMSHDHCMLHGEKECIIHVERG